MEWSNYGDNESEGGGVDDYVHGQLSFGGRGGDISMMIMT